MFENLRPLFERERFGYYLIFFVYVSMHALLFVVYILLSLVIEYFISSFYRKISILIFSIAHTFSLNSTNCNVEVRRGKKSIMNTSRKTVIWYQCPDSSLNCEWYKKKEQNTRAKVKANANEQQCTVHK